MDLLSIVPKLMQINQKSKLEFSFLFVMHPLKWMTLVPMAGRDGSIH